MGRVAGYIATIISAVWVSNTIYANTLHLQDVLHSASAHYPKILEAKQKLQQANASRLSAEGAFDVLVTQETRKRTSGFYDGFYANQKIIKPLREANAKMFAEYRLSDGTFPVYEDQFATLDQGEIAVGVSFSLLRNRDIDAYRLALKNADLDITIQTFQQKAVLNHVLFNASLAYIEWLSATLQFEVYKQLLKNATTRQEAINKRIQLGYSAKIDLLDNEQNVLKREAILLKIKNEVDLRAMKLALYWRDDKGQPIKMAHDIKPVLPTTLFTHIVSKVSPNIDNLIEEALRLHPDIQHVENTILKENNNQQLFKNELKPNADITIKLSQDAGDGSPTREGFESYIGFEFSMPLERRKAKGKIMKSSAKIRELQFVRQRLTEALQVTLNQSNIKFTNATEQASLTQKRASITQTLLAQELKRFEQGASDIFMLNLREKDMAEAKIDAITTDLSRLVAGIELLGKAYKMHSTLN